MKKVFLPILLVFCLLLPLTFVSCNNGEQLNIFVPDGAPSMAVANVIDSGKIDRFKANVTISTGEDVIAKCANGEADIAIIPTNAAVKICSAGNAYSLFSVNVWGLLYVVGWQNINTVTELNGKTVSSIGLGNTGEYLFKRILDVNGVGYENGGVNLNFVDDGTTAVGFLMQNKCDFALIGEPAATNAINKAASSGKTLYRVFDLQQLWKEVTESDSVGYPQASVIVKKDLLQLNGFADTLFNVLSQNNEFLTQNTDRLNDILKSAGSLLSVNYTQDIVARCNINAVKASDVKQDIYKYLSQFNGPFAGMLKDELYYDFGN